MKKILFAILLFVVNSNYVFAKDLNLELNKAIKDSDYNTVVKIFGENNFTKREKKCILI